MIFFCYLGLMHLCFRSGCEASLLSQPRINKLSLPNLLAASLWGCQGLDLLLAPTPRAPAAPLHRFQVLKSTSRGENTLGGAGKLSSIRFQSRAGETPRAP